MIAEYLKDWDGLISGDSVAATVYAYWQYFFYGGFLHQVFDEMTLAQRIKFVGNYEFENFYQRLIKSMLDGSVRDASQQTCSGAYSEYKGPHFCEHNLAMSFVKTKECLDALPDWSWISVHVNEYPNQPWSMTPLKAFWHRETPVDGNTQTPKVSKYNIDRIVETGRFISHHTANLKTVFEFREDPKDNVNYVSIETGMSGNLFGGHYFDMNQEHLDGELPRIETDLDRLEDPYILELHGK